MTTYKNVDNIKVQTYIFVCSRKEHKRKLSKKPNMIKKLLFDNGDTYKTLAGIIGCKSVTTVHLKVNGKRIDINYIIKDIVNYVHPKYELKGFLIRFQAIHGGQITAPLFVLDHKDIFTIQKYISISASMVDIAKTASTKLRAQKWKDYYNFKESCLLLTNIINKEGKTLYSRDLDYGFALTSHKSQGSTFDTTLIDVNDIVYDKFGHPYVNAEEVNRRLYVACSRCKNKLYLRYKLCEKFLLKYER